MMRKALMASVIVGLSQGQLMAADFDNGDELHMDNCTGCHDSSAYTRAERKVTSLKRLGTQVRFCRDNLGLTWFDDEVADVIHYLNVDYYKFP